MANACLLLILLYAFPFCVSSQSDPYLVPTGYHLDLSVPDLATSDIFNGSVEINVTLTGSASELLLGAEDLTVDAASVVVRRWLRTKVWVNESRFTGEVLEHGSLLNISFSPPLNKATYQIHLNYSGRIRDGSRGFIKVPYLYKGETRYISVTNLEATNAQSVFPCFSNNSERTNFVFNVTVSKSQVVLSNVKHDYVHNVSDSTKMFHFSAYPAMPVSQLGWAVFDLSTYSQNTAASTQNTVVHTFAPSARGYENYTSWACNYTALLVAAMANYTNKPYSFNRLNQVVIPDLPVSTVEGWGILSYSGESLLMSPQESSTRQRHRVLLEMSRGMAGQWFQGITSMDSWDDQWFPRGMKEYLKYTVAATLPEMSAWELHDHMVVEMVQTALALDGDMLLPINSSTSYKGASIIRMLHSIVGDKVFRDSLDVYFQESVSKPEDFFNIVETVRRDSEADARVDVDSERPTETAIINSWISATGHPVVDVSNNGSHYTISQSADSKALVQVTYVLQDNPTVMQRWLQPGGVVVVAGAANSTWILLNINLTGFYRVNYNVGLWASLTRQLASDLSRIPRLNRAQLLDDAYMLARRGLLSLDTFMNLSSYLVAETDYFPWLTATRHFKHLLDTLYNHTAYLMLKSHVLGLLDNVVREVGMDPRPQDSHTKKLRQARVLETACAFGHPGCLKRAVALLDSWMSRIYYEPDLNMALLCAGVSNSSSQGWAELLRAFNEKVSPTVRINILNALSCSTNTTLLHGFLTNITSVGSPVLSSKNKNIFLMKLASSSRGAEIILDWIIEMLTLKAAMTPSASVSESDYSMIYQTEYITEPSSSTSESTSTTVTQASSSANIEMSIKGINENVIVNLSEEDATAILAYALPKLTSIEQGAKLEKFFHETYLNWTSKTNSFLEQAINDIYQKNNEKAQKYNNMMVIWLTNALTTTTTSTTWSSGTSSSGGPSGTKPGSSSTPGSTVSHKPNTANKSFSSLVVIMVSVAMSIRTAL